MTKLDPAAPIDFKKLPDYDAHQIKQLLSALPNEIYYAGRKRDQAQQDLDTLRHDLKVKLAKAHMQARRTPDLNLTSSDDRKAFAASQPEVMDAEVAIIKADGELATARLEYERLEMFFVAARKIASLYVELEKAVDGTTKYGSGSRQ